MITLDQLLGRKEPTKTEKIINSFNNKVDAVKNKATSTYKFIKSLRVVSIDK